MQDVEAVPALGDDADLLRQRAERVEHRRPIVARQRSAADDDRRPLGLRQRIHSRLWQFAQRLRTRAEVAVFIGQIGLFADQSDLGLAGQPRLAQAGVQQRRLGARIGADDQHGVGVLDPRQTRVEQPALPRTVTQGRTVLAAVGVGRAQGAEQVQRRLHRFRVLQVAGDDADPVGRSRLQLAGHGVQRLVPGRGAQLAVLAHIRLVQPLALQAVDGVAADIRQPLLVDALVDARQHAHHFRALGVGADVRAQGVHDVDGLGLLQLPRAVVVLPRPVGQGADGTQVVDVARQLAVDVLFEIGGDLGVLAARDHADVRHAGDLGDEADAAGALDAPGHEGLDRRTHVLFFDRALVLGVARAVAAIADRLVLQVAFAALVADRAVQRVIDEQELHHPFARLLDHRRVGEDLLALGGRQGARRLRLRRSGLHLDQAHAAVAGDRQPLMIAEARDLFPGTLGDLKHGHAGLEFDLYAVDLGDGHQRASCSAATE